MTDNKTPVSIKLTGVFLRYELWLQSLTMVAKIEKPALLFSP